MATNKLKTVWKFARHGAWMGLVLAAIFLSVRGGITQDEPISPARTREALRQAIDLYKTQDYEKAAPFFAYAQKAEQNLGPSERVDLTTFSQSNAIALKTRQDGAAQVRLAADALKEGRAHDASLLLKSLNANQNLNPADRMKLSDLNRQLQMQTTGTVVQTNGKTDGKSLLTAGRAAFQAGDLATAEALANEANKSSSMIPNWLQWDSPTKLLRDVQTAKAKQPQAVVVVEETPKTAGVEPNKTTNTTSKFGSLWPFNSAPSPAKKAEDAAERRVDEKMARQMVKDGFFFLEQANEMDKAHMLAMKAKELNVTWAPNEQTPDMLLHEIQRRKGGVVKAPEAPPAQPQVKLPPAPTNGDPRAMLKYGRTLLQMRQIDEADKVCARLIAAKSSWGLFEDTPDKLHRDIQKSRQIWERDESVRLMVAARTAFTKGNIEDAEKKAYKAQQLHGPYGVFDFGDRPQKLLEEIQKVKVARGPNHPGDKKDTTAKEQPARNGQPFPESAGMQAQTKNRAIVMVREAQELERKNMLTDARQKALEARSLRANFAPEEDSPDSVLLSLSAKCDRQIVAHLQEAVKVVADAGDSMRYSKAQVQILMARKLAQTFELDPARIDQTARYVQKSASGNNTGALPFGVAAEVATDVPTGDPARDQARKAARARLQQAQLELSYGKTLQARKMAEELFNPAYGIQPDVLKLIRSIDAEEYNQKIVEAKRTFDAGLEAFMQKDYRKSMYVLQSIDAQMLPEQYQIRLRDIMAMREMQPATIVQAGYQKQKLPATKIDAVKNPNEVAVEGDKESLLDEVRRKEAVHYQALRQRGQEALRSAHELFKNNQKDEALEALNHYIDQVNLVRFETQKAAELRRLPEARIQQYKTMMAEEKLIGIAKNAKYTSFHDEGDRQRKIREHQLEIVEMVKVAKEYYEQNKLKEAIAEAKKVLELDRENQAALAMLHMATNKKEQETYDRAVHGNERGFLDLLNPSLGVMADVDNPVKFKDGHTARKQSDGAITHEIRDPKEKAIDYRLRQPISLHFKDVPLEQAIKDLTVQSGVQVVPDYAALQDAKVNLQSPLSITVDNINMKSALNLMLNQLRLTYIIENQVLMITTENKTKGRLVRVTYPIGDLVVAVPDHPLPDVFNIQKALERAMMPNSSYGNGMGMMPPYIYGAGAPVSSHSNGLGSAFGTQSGRQGSSSLPGPTAKANSKEAMAEVLKDLIQNTVAKNSWESMGGTGAIQYFPFGMALVINQPQEVQEEVALLLATLRRLQDLQVSVELRAVLVSETFFERIGVDFSMNINAPKKAGNAALLAGDLQTATSKGAISGLTSAGTLTPDLGIPIRNSSFNFTTPQFGGYQPEAGLQLGMAFLSEIQVFMFLEAVQGDRRAHIMQAPKITVYNGQVATINGLMVRPVVNSLSPVALGNGQIIQTVLVPNITQMPFGLSMTVQPVVSPDRRFVRLNVSPQMQNGIQDPAGAIVVAVPNNNPAIFENGQFQPQLPNGPLQVSFQPTITNLTIVNTTVNVPDGGTVLLGGFKFLAEERTEYGPPILSKIPYLSRLFRNVGWSRDGSTLIYLITARIIMVEEEERIFLGQDQPIPRQ